MRNARGKSSKIGNAIVYIVIILVVVALGGFFAFFTNGFTGDFKTFYVSMGDESILTNTGGLVLSWDSPITIDVKYTFGALSKEVSGYDVKIVPNADNDFAFLVDGEPYSFSAIDDCTTAFDIQREENSFTINYKSLREILDTLYEESLVDFNKSDVDWEKDLFTMIITSYNGESSICIGFRLEDTIIDKVTLDMEVIEF